MRMILTKGQGLPQGTMLTMLLGVLLSHSGFANRVIREGCTPKEDLDPGAPLHIETVKAAETCTSPVLPGEKVRVWYTAWLMKNCVIIEQSKDFNMTHEWKHGEGAMGMVGLDQGVSGMCLGEVRQVTIPASLGYGEKGERIPPVPPNATVIFEMELQKKNHPHDDTEL